MNYMLMMSTRKYLPQNVDIESPLSFATLATRLRRSTREPHKAVVDIEAMTDQFDVFLNGRKIAVYMAGG